MDRLIHDASFAAATHLLEIVGDCIREEQRRDYFDEAYAVVKAAIEAYSIQVKRMQDRLKPSRN